MAGAAGAVLATAWGAAAQEAPAAQPSETTELEEVVITGSRLGAATAEAAPQPVQVVTSETIEGTGAIQVADFLDRIPALQNSLSSAQATGASTEVPTLNLRGLGANRTLTLVNGRRHVAGVPGQAAVDISSIPTGLIERVDVLTGGASAVYGSDAVTGVVNFVLKDDFDGFELDVQAGLSGQGDAENVYGSALWGRNFGPGDAGNLTISVEGFDRRGITYGDRDFSRGNRQANDYPNPDLFFQESDPLPPAGRNAVGRSILVGGQPRFAGTPQALIDRARAAPARRYIYDPRFYISSTSGLIGIDPFATGFAGPPGDFSTFKDLDRDGVDDCVESRNGRAGFGCWVADPVTGAIRPFRDGIFAGTSNQSGGDGAAETFDTESSVPDEKQVAVNLFFNYELNRRFEPYAELKAVFARTERQAPYNTFDDSIPISLANPFIPAELRAIVNAEIAADPSVADTAQLVISRDNIDLFDPEISTERKTYRAVFGTRGDLAAGFTYDLAFNYGRTEGEERSAQRLEDRYFAAIDAVTDPRTGQPACRSTLDPTALPREGQLGPNAGGVSEFRTFDPRSGQCRPLNLFGLNRNSPEALAFQRYISSNEYTIEQTVVTGVVVGDTADFFELQGGPVGLVLGAEYRKEESEFDADEVLNQGFNFQARTTADVAGEFDVEELFGEVRLPVLADLPFAHELTVSAAGRAGKYSTVGSTTTYRFDAVYAPIEDIRFRGGKALTVRAPNISELFAPLQAANSRPIDPCDQANINSGPAPANRARNCAADGIPVGFTDPLTAQFAASVGGNPNLQEEESDSYTYGVVLQPRFLRNFSLTVDYFDIRIENAIAQVTDQDIVNSCYDAPSLDNQFCTLFTRNRNPGSPTFLGFNSLVSTQLNFAALETSGIDVGARYGFDFADLGRPTLGDLTVTFNGTYLEDADDFPFVQDPDQANPSKLEINFPEYAFNLSLDWNVGAFRIFTSSNYQSKQAYAGVEVEDADTYVEAFSDPIWIHDASVRWSVREDLDLTLGVQNLTDEEPFVGSRATPVSGVGRYFFFRASANF